MRGRSVSKANCEYGVVYVGPVIGALKSIGVGVVDGAVRLDALGQ